MSGSTADSFIICLFFLRLLAELHHSRAARIRVAGGGAGAGGTPLVGSAPDAQASAPGLLHGQSQPGVMKSWSCTSCAFMPISWRPFPPLAKGGQGGWFRHDQSQGLPMLSPSQSFRIPRARREESFSLSKAPASPPLPPLRKGGKGDRSLATSFHPATKTRVSKSSLQLSQRQLFTSPAPATQASFPIMGYYESRWSSARSLLFIHRHSHTRNTDRSCSGSTGLAT